MESTVNRRPLSSRSHAWAQVSARVLAGCGVRPNHISLASLVFAAVAAAALWAMGQTNEVTRLVALALAAVGGIQLRLVCNLLDGLVAVEHHQRTPTGGLYNEVPARVADVLILLGVGCALASLPWAMTVAWFAAVLAVGTAYVRALGAAETGVQQFVGPMAKPHRMALCTVAILATPIAAWAGYTTAPLAVMLIILVCGMLVTCGRRLSRIAGDLQSFEQQATERSRTSVAVQEIV